MNYVKHFNLFGTEARQITCLELEGVPTSSTEGEVGVLGIDVTSDTLDLYKCIYAKNDVYAWEKLIKDVIQTASSVTDIKDVAVDSGELKGIKEVKFYGYTSQVAGATLSSPKAIKYYNPINSVLCCGSAITYFNGRIDYPLFAVNNYKDCGWVDLINDKIHYKRFIKKIVLDGTETYKKGNTTYSSWQKASSPEGRYFVNLHLIDGLFTDEDKARLDGGISIAYDDAKCTIGDKYFSGSFTESGQFNIVQGVSPNGGYFRFQFFAPEFSTLDEVLAQVKKNPITLFIPMIYEVYEDELNCNTFSSLIKRNGKNPFNLYVYNFENPANKYPTEVTYKTDIGLSLSSIKDAIISLGGNV